MIIRTSMNISMTMDHTHEHDHEHTHGHEHSHDHECGHFHRSFRDIRQMIQNSELSKEGERSFPSHLYQSSQS